MKILFLDKSPYWTAKHYKDSDIIFGIHNCREIMLTGYFVGNMVSAVITTVEFITMTYPYRDKCSFDSVESKWACKSLANWSWILYLGMALCIEQHTRFDKIDESALLFRWCYQHPPNLPMNLPLSEFPIIQKELTNERRKETNYSCAPI
jgi:hypothetical protein